MESLFIAFTRQEERSIVMVEGWKMEIVFYKVEVPCGTLAGCKVSFTMYSQKVIRVEDKFIFYNRLSQHGVQT